MKFSHADYMAEQIHRALTLLLLDYPVKMVADLAGCSTSLIYSWSDPAAADGAKAKYIFALAARLAERGDYRFLQMLLPVGASIEFEKNDEVVNGNCDDESADGTIALAQATLAHRGKNPDAIADARGQLKNVLRRLEKEEIKLRGEQASQPHSA